MDWSTELHFYQLTWPAKQRAMTFFKVETVEEAAELFNAAPSINMKQIFSTGLVEFIDGDCVPLTHPRVLIMSRYVNNYKEEE